MRIGIDARIVHYARGGIRNYVLHLIEALGLLVPDDLGDPGDEPPYEPEDDPCQCDEMFDNDVVACFAESSGCDLTCAAVAIVAFAYFFLSSSSGNR